MSASDPIAIVPLRGCSPYILAWFVALTATKWLSVIRPFTTPSENKIGSRVSTPGTPFGTQRKLVRPFGTNFPAGSSYLNGQWSEENIWNIPPCSPLQQASWLARSRGGGL